MKEKDIIKEAMKTCGWNQEQLAQACGYKTQSAIGNRLSGNSMRVDTFVKLLSAMGYEIIVKSVSPITNKNKWIVSNETSSVNLDELLADDVPIIKTDKGIRIKLSSKKEEV